MGRINKKSLIYILLACLIVSLLPFNAFGYLGYPPYPSDALTSIDPEIEMTSQDEWMDHVNNPLLKYRIKHSQFEFNDFMYEANWRVSIDGKRSTKNIMIMRPRGNDNAGLGRTFVKPSELREWGKNLNGNPDYVEKTANAKYLTPIENTLSGSIVAKRVYIHDLSHMLKG